MIFARTSLIFCVGLGACGNDSVSTGVNELPPASGTELWQQRVPVSLIDVTVAPDGSVYAIGGSSRMWLGKFAPDGAPEWAHEGDASLGVAVVVGRDGGIYAATTTFGALDGARYVARFDADGARAWTLDQEDRSVSALAPAPGGGVYAAGENLQGPFFQRIDGAGTLVWSQDEPGLVDVADVALGQAGELLATGMGARWWAQARDGDGTLVWSAELGQPLPAGPFQSIAVDRTGDLTIVAMTQNDAAGRGYLTKLRADGSILLTAQPLTAPPTEIVRTDDAWVIAHLVPPIGVEAQDDAGKTRWSLVPDSDCSKTLALDAAPDTAIVALSQCSEGSRLAAIQP